MPSRTTSAILIERHGPPGVLVERSVPLRAPGPEEVTLRVQAVGVNFADLVMRAGMYGTVPPRPYSPGFEVTGEIVEVGAEVEGWRAGERAVALIRYGGYAREVTVHVRNLFRAPASLSAAECAAVPVAFLTAWFALFETGIARPGDAVLILGAGGGVGTAAVQLAVWRGLRAIGTAGAEAKRRFVVEGLGADACFDSHGDWEGEVRALVGGRGIDIALDAMGGRATASCRRLLAPLGRLVFYGMSEAVPGQRRNWLRAAWAWLTTPRIHPYALVEPCIGVAGIHLLHLGPKEDILRSALERLFAAVVAGELRPVLDRTFPLTGPGAVAAHRYIHERRNLGKVVLVAPDAEPAAR
jgi:NADPH:quinone reductase-like Zn-dependent oxidoreductase